MIYIDTDNSCGGNCPPSYRNCAICSSSEYKSKMYCCDECKEESSQLTLYEYEGKQLCEKCVLKRVVGSLTEEELSSIFPCRFRYYTVNWAIGGTTGAGDLYEYDADGNTKQLGSFGTDDSYRTREEINPNWPEINGSWRIEDGKLIRTITSGNQEKRYIVKSLDRDGYYLLCFESATGEVNAVMMIVLYDENNMPLYEFTEN